MKRIRISRPIERHPTDTKGRGGEGGGGMRQTENIRIHAYVRKKIHIYGRIYRHTCRQSYIRTYTYITSHTSYITSHTSYTSHMTHHMHHMFDLLVKTTPKDACVDKKREGESRKREREKREERGEI